MHDNKYVGTNHYVPLIKKKKLYATKPWPCGFIVIPGEESCQDVPIDLSTSQVEIDQNFDEQLIQQLCIILVTTGVTRN